MGLFKRRKKETVDHKHDARLREYDNQLNEKIKNKENSISRLEDEDLLKIFNEYFVPNSQFYSNPNSLEFKAYFGAINAAIPEMFNAATIFEQATQRTQNELLQMLNNRIPGLTNSLICALIFCVGQFAVIKDTVYCIDFSEKIPNCIALYLLLISQKEPAEARKQLIDAGEGTNTVFLKNAVEALKVCDSYWQCIIL